MNTGTDVPDRGFSAYEPVKTPDFSRDSAVRSCSERDAARFRYASTASPGVAAPPVHLGSTPSGQATAVSDSTSGCSGASTTYVAPNSVSGRVVNTRI